MLLCRLGGGGGTGRCGGRRGGGGRGGGGEQEVLVIAEPLLAPGAGSGSCSEVSQDLLKSLETRPRLSPSSPASWLLLLLLLLLPTTGSASSSFTWSLVVCAGVSGLVSEGGAVWWTLAKRGLMKQSAPLLWQHSNSEGVRVRNRGRVVPGLVSKVTRVWAGGGGLSGGAVAGDDQETARFLPRQRSEFQKPVGRRTRRDE